ncbi:hypothetical protein DNI29_16440 [Hymenobacter sediminis]|uniref:MbnP family protein n=1 Tax=Hymenobacter sediminis TaxID=2218621 RepID=UPI000F4E558C|nr:MbnP family protein [Hymenobacter sediminis]RPD45745.1 hypothetical protein DNI29_16440 [Hymenobacter sediminis]
MLVSCKDTQQDEVLAPPTGKVVLEFDHVVGNQALDLETTTYTNAAGNPFTVNTFNYYISNIKLTQADGTVWSETESYHLVKESDASSQQVTLQQVPAGKYTRLTFTIGVDSARNVAGAQAGALEPRNGMFWTWNSGYIFTKLEGRSEQAPGNKALIFHIGGFKAPNNTIRTISPALPGNAPLQVQASHDLQVHLKVDVLGMFNGPTPNDNIDFRTLYDVMGGREAVRLADNYAAGMFRIDYVK